MWTAAAQQHSHHALKKHPVWPACYISIAIGSKNDELHHARLPFSWDRLCAVLWRNSPSSASSEGCRPWIETQHIRLWRTVQIQTLEPWNTDMMLIWLSTGHFQVYFSAIIVCELQPCLTHLWEAPLKWHGCFNLVIWLPKWKARNYAMHMCCSCSQCGQPVKVNFWKGGQWNDQH